MLRGGLGMLLVILLLQQQIRTCKEEGVGRILGGDHRYNMAKLGAESTKHVEDMGSFTDSWPMSCSASASCLRWPVYTVMSRSPWTKLWNSASR
jgi:hypothetical protein